VIRDTGQNIGEPGLGIDTVQLGGFDQGEGDGHGVSAALSQVGLPPMGRHTRPSVGNAALGRPSHDSR